MQGTRKSILKFWRGIKGCPGDQCEKAKKAGAFIPAKPMGFESAGSGGAGRGALCSGLSSITAMKKRSYQ